MEISGGSVFAGSDFNARKKRSNGSRRPRRDSQSLMQGHNFMPQPTQHLVSGTNEVGSDGLGSDNKLKKLKLKLGGVTHTIHAKSAADYASGGQSFGESQRQQLSLRLDNGDSSCFYPTCGGKDMRIQSKDFSGIVSSSGSFSRGKVSGVLVNATNNNESVRKSRRIPKRRVLDVGFDDDEDEEIRYLGKLNSSKLVADQGYEEDERREKKWRILKITTGSRRDDAKFSNAIENLGSRNIGKDDRKKSRSDKVYEDQDYIEEEEPISDDEPESEMKQKRVSLDLYVGGRNELIPTTRKQALLSGKDVLSGGIECPNGLPSSPPKKQKDKFTEVEQQLKKVEAAQRRKMQSEKAAREAEAEAIKKILGQDSGRKKKEEKKRHALAQERGAKTNTLASNTVRWINSPNGTVVVFSQDIALPSIFNSAPCSYPPPREKCAGPNCTNAYKYRDSKSNLPLCSLQCYKAIS
ncbi:uncharacterized protein LOC119991909 isoform X2 [Tripterygium wilfordii]|uniref:uncharacterized protein LOC119991909 isoform X2 n=1 Tax=Tripterygium wilfordii TaxID=458696 RepID=UPI0018F861D9|nr:uncharacterized protein LOC119991909 isoform X2 [Tripterygium wilfordii]